MVNLLHDQNEFERQIDALCALIPAFAPAYQMTGKIALRSRETGIETVMQIIISQQVSVASAKAIWERLQISGMLDVTKIREASLEDLRALGLSKQKATYFKSLAQSDVDFEKLANMSDQDVIHALTAIKGIGRWSAEIYLMFSLRRPDVIAANDLALQEGARTLFNLPERPSEKSLRTLSESWSPYRNCASQLLWAYYHVIKQREGIGV